MDRGSSSGKMSESAIVDFRSSTCDAEIWYRMYIEGLKKDDLQNVLNNVA